MQTQTSNQTKTEINKIGQVLESYDLEEARKMFEILKNMNMNEEILPIKTIEEQEVVVKRFPDRILCRYVQHECKESLGQLDPTYNTWNTIRIYKMGNGYRVRLLSYDKIRGVERLTASFTIGRVIDALDVLCNILYSRVVA
jgi:hypothetical protein